MRELNYYWFFLNWQIIEAKLGENKNRLKVKGGGGGGGGGGGLVVVQLHTAKQAVATGTAPWKERSPQ